MGGGEKALLYHKSVTPDLRYGRKRGKKDEANKWEWKKKRKKKKLQE